MYVLSSDINVCNKRKHASDWPDQNSVGRSAASATRDSTRAFVCVEHNRTAQAASAQQQPSCRHRTRLKRRRPPLSLHLLPPPLFDGGRPSLQALQGAGLHHRRHPLCGAAPWQGGVRDSERGAHVAGLQHRQADAGDGGAAAAARSHGTGCQGRPHVCCYWGCGGAVQAHAQVSSAWRGAGEGGEDRLAAQSSRHRASACTPKQTLNTSSHPLCNPRHATAPHHMTEWVTTVVTPRAVECSSCW